MTRILSILLLSVLVSGAANLLPNSSFETGMRLWHSYDQKDNSGMTNAIQDMVADFDAFHGDRSFGVPGRVYLLSAPVWLESGDHTLSFHGKRGTSAADIRVYLAALDGSNGPYVDISLTTSWARYSMTTNIVAGWYYPIFNHFGLAATNFIDAVQLETGATVTAWEPNQEIEQGLDTGKYLNTYWSPDTKELSVNWWNEGVATNKHLLYEIFDFRNRRIQSGTNEVELAAGTNTTSVITLNNAGWQRVTTRIADVPNSRSEICLSVFEPNARPIEARDGRTAGLHNWSPYTVTNSQSAGIAWTRPLSAGLSMYRMTVIEPASNVFNWPTNEVQLMGQSGMKILIPLSTPDTTNAPMVASSWMTNASGGVNLTWVSNFGFRYSRQFSNQVHAYEMFNEPGHSQGDWMEVPANYASVVEIMARAIKQGDPTALVIAMGGVGGNGTGSGQSAWAKEVWDLLSTDVKDNYIDAISLHFYPIANEEGRDMSATNTFQIRDIRYQEAWDDFISVGVPVWNTESGTWGAGDYQGVDGLYRYRTEGTFSNGEYDRAEESIRQAISVERLVRAAVRTLGIGMDKYFYYGSWSWGPDMIGFTHPSSFDLDTGSYKTIGHALSVFALMMDDTTTAFPFTNQTHSAIESYIHSSPASNIVTIFAADRVERQLTISNETAVTVYNAMGVEEPITGNTFLVDRIPKYVVSTTLPAHILSNTIVFAGSTIIPDTKGPNITMDIAPTGLWPGGEALIKYHAKDERYWNDRSSESSKTNIVYFVEIDDGGYNAYIQTNFFRMTLGAGNHTIGIKALDVEGNESELIYEFSPDVEAGEEGGGTPAITGRARKPYRYGTPSGVFGQ